MKTETIYQFYSDAGHGWLAVPWDDITELDIQSKITSCSYVSKTGAMVYLEEDCDCATFFKAYEALTGKRPTYTTNSTNRSSHIRKYKRYHYNAGL